MRSWMRNSVALLFLAAGLLALPGCGIEDSINGGGDSSPDTGTYAGTTSQGLPIAFSVTPAGQVESVRFGWRARCEDGQVHVNSILLSGAKIQNDAFAVGDTLETGGVAHVTGRFDGSRVSGILSRSRGTAFGVNCRATGISWSAEPGSPQPMPTPSTDGGSATPAPSSLAPAPAPDPNSGAPSSAYSGTTSQGLPITVTVSNSYVSMVQFGWRASCEDGQVHENTIVLRGGVIQDGSFRTGGTLETGGIAHVSGHFDGGTVSGVLSRSRGSAFGVNCTATGIRWQAQAGAPVR
jgi:hypothetical protein